MKICVISSTVFSVPPRGYSGLEVIAWECANGLAAKGHEVSLVAPDGSECPGVQMIFTGPPGTWGEKEAYTKYWQELLNYDCIISHDWQKWAMVLKMEGKLKCPVLCVMHAPVNTMYQKLPPVEKPCFVCISKDQAAHFEAIHGREARVCYNGIDPSYYQPIGIPRTDRLLFLARFSSVKSPMECIEVCEKTDSCLDMIGDTKITNEPELLQSCLRRADGKKMIVHGGCSRGEAVWWYSKARALIHLNNRFREPFGLAPVEAISCGCPVLAWNFGAMRETVIPGKNGFLVSSLNDAVDVIRSGALDKIDRSVCRQTASRFSVQSMIDRYEELCREAIENGGW